MERWYRRRPVVAGVLASLSLLVVLVAVAGGVDGWKARSALSHCLSPENRQALLADTGQRHVSVFDEAFEAYVGVPAVTEDVIGAGPEVVEKANLFFDAWGHLMEAAAVASCYEKHCDPSERSRLDSIGEFLWDIVHGGVLVRSSGPTCADERPGAEEIVEEFQARLGR